MKRFMILAAAALISSAAIAQTAVVEFRSGTAHEDQAIYNDAEDRSGDR